MPWTVTVSGDDTNTDDCVRGTLAKTENRLALGVKSKEGMSPNGFSDNTLCPGRNRLVANNKPPVRTI